MTGQGQAARFSAPSERIEALNQFAWKIEIFVHPDDEAKAIEIMGEDDKV
jgi:hypothetical protein